MIRSRVLVLLAAHNGASWVHEQVDSILSQAHVEVHLVVSDDGSSDDTTERLSRFDADKRFQLVAPDRPTGSAAQNFLWLIRNADATQCDYVALSDQDDVWLPDKLIRAICKLTEYGSMGYSSAVTAFWSNGEQRVLAQRPTPRGLDFMFEGAGQGCSYVMDGLFFRRAQEFFREHDAITLALRYHDWALYALSRSWGLAWHFDQVPMVRYRQHELNDTGARLSRRGLSKRLRLIRSGWYRNQLRVIADIAAAADPANAEITTWKTIVHERTGMSRQLKIAWVCVRKGRRRMLDNAVLAAAALLGWI